MKDYCAPDSIIYDGAQEQIIPGTKFQPNLIKYGIPEHTSERERSNKNLEERFIRELRKKWYRETFRTYCTRQLWIYGYPYIAKIMPFMASHAERLQG